jgi:hypothetical protein
LTRFPEDMFMETTECGRLARFWLEWGWVRDVGNFTYPKREGVSDFFSEWGGVWFRRVYRLVLDVGGVSWIVAWPSLNTNTFLIPCGDFEFGVGDEGVKGFVPPDEEPGVIDKFEG